MKCPSCKHDMEKYDFHNEYGDFAYFCMFCDYGILSYNNKWIEFNIEEKE